MIVVIVLCLLAMIIMYAMRATIQTDSVGRSLKGWTMSALQFSAAADQAGKEDQTAEHVLQEKKQKYEEIIAMLIEAGYFRAQIQTLSQFDKVVGGLCWCIVNSGEAVDADILFTENATIGQRITLSEAIVSAMRQMQCPYPLQPHQIQGGVTGADFAAINPVIKWLVIKFISRREEREAQLRKFSELQFEHDYKFSTDVPRNFITEGLEKVLASNKVNRRFRHKQSRKDSEQRRVHSVLMEYGEISSLIAAEGVHAGTDALESFSGEDGFEKFKFDGKSNNELSAFERKLAQAAREAEKEQQAWLEQSNKEEAELLKDMKEVGENQALGGNQVGAIVGIGSSEIGSAAAQYQQDMAEAQKELDNSMAMGKLGQAAAYNRQKSHLLKQKEDVDGQVAETQVESESCMLKLKHSEEEKVSTIAYNVQLTEQIEKLKILEEQANQGEELKMLKHLILLNESFKQQELGFKASCKAQLKDLTAKAEVLESTVDDVQEEDKKLKDIENMYNQVMSKYNRLRQVLADANLEVANTVRTIDDIPTRTELIQYERRFNELYQQVAWKLDETRKYYDYYNQLDTSLGFIQKNVKLLNSISDNFDVAMKSQQTKNEYLEQCDQIVRGVESTVVKQEGILSKKTDQVEELQETHSKLVEKQRSYFKAVKDFQDECTKNEMLMTKLSEVTGQQ